MSTYIKTFSSFINESVSDDPHGIKTFMNSPEYKQILARGYTLKSSPLQIKNGTLALRTEFNYDLLFMAKTLYVRKYKHGYDRQAVIVQYHGLTPEQYWRNAADLLLNKFDIMTGTMSSESKKGSRLELKTVVADHIDSFNLPTELALLFKKQISYSNLKGNIEEIRAELQKAFYVEGSDIFVKDRVRSIKVNTANIIERFPESEYHLNLIFTAWFNPKTFDGKHLIKQSSNIKYLVENCRSVTLTGDTDSDNADVKVLDWDNNDHWHKIQFHGFYDRFAKIEAPAANVINVGFTDSSECTVVINTEANSLKVIMINTRGTEIRTNVDPSNILVASSNFAKTEPEFVPYSEQYNLKVRSLDGTGNDDHNTDIDLHGAVNDLW